MTKIRLVKDWPRWCEEHIEINDLRPEAGLHALVPVGGVGPYKIWVTARREGDSVDGALVGVHEGKPFLIGLGVGVAVTPWLETGRAEAIDLVTSFYREHAASLKGLLQDWLDGNA